MAVIILAAGLGTRMKSDKAKVLHEILGKAMVLYVVGTAKKVAGNNVILVIGNQAEKVREIVSKEYEAVFALQKEQLGTGHAVSCALPSLTGQTEHVLILCGDVPLIRADTLTRFTDEHLAAERDISLLAVQIDDPAGYGRILTDENMNLTGIVEEADATEEQKKINTINTGIYCVRKQFLTDVLQKIRPDNAQGEFYLTDIIGIGYKEGKRIGVMVGDNPNEVMGINTLHDLATVESIMRSGKI
ncbi:NTP transferase domain-containing protein [Desulfobacterales bacterium HSG2]|nr:NTP transferase domain-containing protein [Desulfobacterales bacterium HSG2]